jgi:hypothetical protein
MTFNAEVAEATEKKVARELIFKSLRILCVLCAGIWFYFPNCTVTRVEAPFMREDGAL